MELTSEKILKVKMGLVLLLSRVLQLLIKLKNKLPLVKKTTVLESLLNKVHLKAANLIGKIIDSSFKKVNKRMSNISRKLKRPLKTKAKVASKAKKPRKVARARTRK